MPKTTQRERLLRLIAEQEATIRVAFRSFVRDVRSESVIREVADFLDKRNIEGVLKVVDRYVLRLGTELPKVSYRGIISQLEELSSTNRSISYDPYNPRIVSTIRQNVLAFVSDFGGKQREIISSVIMDGLGQGLGIKAIARKFRDSIGLTATQKQMVQNYTDLLARGSSEALDRKLRDRTYDGFFENAVDDGKPLTVAQIELMTGRYYKRMVARRAEVIARTEATRALNLARQEVSFGVADQLALQSDEVKRTWHTTLDGRQRDTHDAMDGQEVGLNEPFVSPSGARLMYPGDSNAPLEETINCRCIVTVEIRNLQRRAA